MLQALITIVVICIVAWGAVKILGLIPMPIVPWLMQILIVLIYVCAAIGILYQLVPLLTPVFRMLSGGHL